MSRHALAPILLLLGAALSAAAVFAVHRIEAKIGPFTEPYATRYFSPAVGPATIRFTTHEPEQVTLRIHDERGNVVRTLLDMERVDGARMVPWDGRDEGGERMRDGRYSARLTRVGDSRTYAPARPIEIDTKAPAGTVLQLRLRKEQLVGIGIIEREAQITFEDPAGARIDAGRGWRVQPGTLDPELLARRTTDGEPLRFVLPVAELDNWKQLRVVGTDRAGNRTQLGTVSTLLEQDAD